MRKKIISALLFCLPLSFFAQSKDVLLTVNEEPVFVDDFKRMYQKNLEIVDENLHTSIDNYLDLYIDYILKVKEAKELDLDEEKSFQREYNKYRTQLVNKYMTNIEVTDKLVKEAYDRMQQAVNASHILINVSANASPEDTLKAYKRIMEIRKEIMAGKDFGEMAKKYSEDPSAKKNSGNLGWFTVFQMVYPFETTAYETKVGEISMPVRTNFGYHLVKVLDKRPAKGKVTVAHIMIVPKDSIDAEKRIREIYKQVKKGVAFDSLAKKYSDDRNTAIYGGKLDPFGPGALNSKKFEGVAFAMKKPGSVSEPFETQFGWHIVKLIEKHPIGSFEEELPKIEEQVRKDSRARVITENLMDELRERYDFKRNTEALDYFYETVGDGILNGSWYIEHLDFPDKNIIEIKDEAKTYGDFAGYMAKMQKIPNKEESKQSLINKFYKDFTDKFILDYHRSHLEDANPEFAAVAKEYYNGLLLFDLMEEKIWNAAKIDTLGLEKYFKANKTKYASDSLSKIRGRVVGDYQNWLEKEWMQALHDKYEVEINNKALRKIKREFDEK
jgi:peptidyl-prolyl cis-trans isomerase SurA